MQSQRTTDHKLDLAFSCNPQLIDLLCQFYRIKLFPLDRQCDHIGIFPDMAHKALCFFLLDLLTDHLGSTIRRLFICHLYDLQLAVF